MAYAMRARRALGWTIWVAGVAPALRLAWLGAHDGLGANPIEELEHQTGLAALCLLLATLAVTPLRRVGFAALAPFRRRLGLLSFAYVLVHFSLWIGFDNGLDPAAIVEDIAKRPYVTAGFAAFVLLVPLAVTSTRGAVRRLGRRWVQLHRLVYPAACLAVVHYLWLVKKDLRPPLEFAAVLAVLLVARLVIPRSRARAAPSRLPRKGAASAPDPPGAA